jgi:hypothetical protein
LFDANTESTWVTAQVFANTGITGSARGIKFGDKAGTKGAGIVGISRNTTGGRTELGFITSVGNQSFERMRIDENGKIGIGTTSPLEKLDVAGNATASGNLTFYGAARTIGATSMNTLTLGNSSTGNLILNPGGNVGVGTTAPATSLDVNGPLRFGAYESTALPTAGVSGRLARVSNDVRGLWMDQGTQWFSLTGETVNVKEFGAKGDGVTDDTAAFSAALDAANGKTLYLPPGTYKISSAISKTTWNGQIVGSGIGKTVLDFSSLSSGTGLTLKGVLTVLSGTLSASASAGAQTFSVSDATGISTNDWLSVRPTFVGSGTVTATNGSATVTGSGTSFTAQFSSGDRVIINSTTHGASKGTYTIQTVDSDTQITLTSNWANGTVSGAKLYNAEDKWSSSRQGYYKGEWLKVEAVSGTTITPQHTLYDSYRSGTPVSRLDPIKVSIKGVEFKFNANIRAVQIEDALFPVVEDVKIAGARESGLSFQDSVGVRVNRYYNEDTWYSGTGTSYGLVTANVHDVDIANCHITDGRHAIAIGAAASGGVSRHIRIHDCYLRSDKALALDSHGIAEYFDAYNNTIIGGAGSAAYRTNFHDNNVYPNKTFNPGVGFTSNGSDRNSLEYVIENNTFHGDVSSSGSSGLIDIAQTQGDKDEGHLIIRNNRLIHTGALTGYLLYVDISDETFSHQLVDISDNIFTYRGSQGSTQVNGATFIRNHDGIFRNVRISRNQLYRSSFNIRGRITDLTVEDNSIYEPSWTGITVTTHNDRGVTNSAQFSRNVVQRSSLGGISITGDLTATARVTFTANKLFNNNLPDSNSSTSQRSGLFAQQLDRVIVEGNELYDNQATPTQRYGAYLTTIGQSSVYGNRTDGNTTAGILDNASTKIALGIETSLGIGTTSPLATLDVRGNSGTTPAASISAQSSFASLIVDNKGVGDLFTASKSGAKKFTILNNGNVEIVGTATTCTIGNGTSATNCSSSDKRLKENIISLSEMSGLDAIKLLNPVSFNWNSWMIGNGASSNNQFGFIAQDVGQIFPNLVEQDQNSGFYKLDYQGLFAPIVKSIKELDVKVAGTSSSSAASVDSTALSKTLSTLQTQVDNQGLQITDLRSLIASISSSPILPLSPISSLASSGAEISLDKLDVKDATVSGTLDVLGRATFSDVGVTGNITTGLLSIHGLEGEINTIGQPLKLQSLRTNNIDLMAGKVIIDPAGNVTAKGEITVKKYNIDISDPDSASFGRATLKANTSSLTVKTKAVKGKSGIFLTPRAKTGGQTLAVGSVTDGDSFTVEVEHVVTNNVPFDWWIVN